MFSTCSELTPRAPIPDGRMAQFMQPCLTLISATSPIEKIVRKENGRNKNLHGCHPSTSNSPLWCPLLTRVPGHHISSNINHHHPSFNVEYRKNCFQNSWFSFFIKLSSVSKKCVTVFFSTGPPDF